MTLLSPTPSFVFGVADFLWAVLVAVWEWIVSHDAKTIQASAAVVSVVVSLLLYRGYQQQTKIDEAQHEPVIQADRYSERGGRNEIEVNVSNYGKGVARNLRGRVVITPIATQTPDTHRGKLKVWCLNKRPLTASSWPELTRQQVEELETWEQVYGCKLAPGEHDVGFRVELSLNTALSYVPDRTRRKLRRTVPSHWRRRTPVQRFGPAVRELSADPTASPDDGPRETSGDASPDQLNHYRLKVYVEYEDTLGRTGREQVFDYVVPAVEGFVLSDALAVGTPYQEFVQDPGKYRGDVVRALLEQ